MNPTSPNVDPAGQDPLAELSALTSGLLHEIRNPLSTLKINLQLLAEDYREIDQFDSRCSDIVRRGMNRVQTMIREVDRLADLLERFMRYAVAQELHCEPYDLNGFVR